MERGSGRIRGGGGGEIQMKPDGPKAVAVYILDRVLTCELLSHTADPTLGPLASFFGREECILSAWKSIRHVSLRKA